MKIKYFQRTFLEKVIDKSPIAISIVNENKEIIYANKEFKRRFSEEPHGIKCYKVTDPNETPCTDCLLQHKRENKLEGTRLSKKIISADGKEIHVLQKIFKNEWQELYLIEYYFEAKKEMHPVIENCELTFKAEKAFNEKIKSVC